jgi:hypothetical protein
MKRITITIDGSDTTHMKAGVRSALSQAICDYNLTYGIQSPLHSYKLGDVEEFDAALNRKRAYDSPELYAFAMNAKLSVPPNHEQLTQRLRDYKGQNARLFGDVRKLTEENSRHRSTITTLLQWLAKEHPAVSQDLALHLLGKGE